MFVFSCICTHLCYCNVRDFLKMRGCNYNIIAHSCHGFPYGHMLVLPTFPNPCMSPEAFCPVHMDAVGKLYDWIWLECFFQLPSLMFAKGTPALALRIPRRRRYFGIASGNSTHLRPLFRAFFGEAHDYSSSKEMQRWLLATKMAPKCSESTAEKHATSVWCDCRNPAAMILWPPCPPRPPNYV